MKKKRLNLFQTIFTNLTVFLIVFIISSYEQLSKNKHAVVLSAYHYGDQLEVIQQTQSAGKQQVIWNAKGLPNGVYFYVLNTDKETRTMKMIKMK